MIFKKLMLFMFMAVLLSSCTEDFFTKVIEEDISETNPILALGAFFVKDQDQARCLLTKSRGLLDKVDGIVDKIPDGTVTLYMPDGTEIPFGYYEGSHNFQSEVPVNFEEGKTYSIKATYPGYKDISATVNMPEFVDVDSVTYDEKGRLGEYGNELAGITVHFNDPPEKENYYRAVVVSRSDNPNIQSESRHYPEIFDPELSVFREEVLIDGSTIDGEKYSFTIYFNDYHNKENENLYLIWSTISKDHYLFSRRLKSILDAEDNPFASPIPTYTNITNGQGLFSVYEERLIYVAD